MPSHPKTTENQVKRGVGGPLKRTGPKAEDWNNLIGPSLDCLPSTQLPTVRTVLQRYRAMRIEDPSGTKAFLAKLIATEAKLIWDKARVPTIAEKNCIRKVLDKIELWNSHHNRGDENESLQNSLNALLDLAPKLRGKGQRQGDDFVMRAPGALHHARFLASCLYIMKLTMLGDVLPPGLVTPNMRTNLDSMAEYISLFHGPWFLQASVSTIAPRLDLQLWQHMCLYEETDAAIAQAVKLSILRHLWYLTEPLVILGLFDRDLSVAEKQEMATALYHIPKPLVFPPVKPRFPDLQNDDAAGLPQLVGPRSWLLFHLLQMDGEWLNTPADEWDRNDQYLEMLSVVENLAVVNDAAERGVKDIQDYANAARDGSSRERIILVSNSHRIKLPRFLKNEMQENL